MSTRGSDKGSGTHEARPSSPKPIASEGGKTKKQNMLFSDPADMLNPVSEPVVMPKLKGLSGKEKQKAEKHACEKIMKRAEEELIPQYWWQPSPVIYRFSDSIVRHRMMKLMGTETVRILDREFMATLAHKLLERNWENIQERIENRQNWELDRERQLVFDGMLPLEDGPPGFSEHPYFAIMTKVAEEVEKKKAKIELSQTRKRLIPMFDYSIFVTEDDSDKVKEKKSDVSLAEDDLPNNNVAEVDRQDGEDSVKNMVDTFGNWDVEEFERGRYEALQVKALRKAKTVEDMYKMASKIFTTV